MDARRASSNRRRARERPARRGVEWRGVIDRLPSTTHEGNLSFTRVPGGLTCPRPSVRAPRINRTRATSRDPAFRPSRRILFSSLRKISPCRPALFDFPARRLLALGAARPRASASRARPYLARTRAKLLTRTTRACTSRTRAPPRLEAPGARSPAKWLDTLVGLPSGSRANPTRCLGARPPPPAGADPSADRREATGRGGVFRLTLRRRATRRSRTASFTRDLPPRRAAASPRPTCTVRALFFRPRAPAPSRDADRADRPTPVSQISDPLARANQREPPRRERRGSTRARRSATPQRGGGACSKNPLLAALLCVCVLLGIQRRVPATTEKTRTNDSARATPLRAPPTARAEPRRARPPPTPVETAGAQVTQAEKWTRGDAASGADAVRLHWGVRKMLGRGPRRDFFAATPRCRPVADSRGTPRNARRVGRIPIERDLEVRCFRIETVVDQLRRATPRASRAGGGPSSRESQDAVAHGRARGNTRKTLPNASGADRRTDHHGALEGHQSWAGDGRCTRLPAASRERCTATRPSARRRPAQARGSRSERTRGELEKTNCLRDPRRSSRGECAPWPPRASLRVEQDGGAPLALGRDEVGSAATARREGGGGGDDANLPSSRGRVRGHQRCRHDRLETMSHPSCQGSGIPLQRKIASGLDARRPSRAPPRSAGRPAARVASLRLLRLRVRAGTGIGTGIGTGTRCAGTRRRPTRTCQRRNLAYPPGARRPSWDPRGGRRRRRRGRRRRDRTDIETAGRYRRRAYDGDEEGGGGGGGANGERAKLSWRPRCPA